MLWLGRACPLSHHCSRIVHKQLAKQYGEAGKTYPFTPEQVRSKMDYCEKRYKKIAHMESGEPMTRSLRAFKRLFYPALDRFLHSETRLLPEVVIDSSATEGISLGAYRDST